MKKRQLVLLSVLALVVGVVGTADAARRKPERAKHDRFVDTTRDSDEEIYGHYSHQHGPSSGHLPPTQEDVAVVGKTKLTTTADRISDVAVLGDFAYLGQWAAGLPSPKCRACPHPSAGAALTWSTSPTHRIPKRWASFGATRTPM
jgi:hypothetical protein